MKVKVTDLVLRDGHQSLIATRMRTEDMLPIAPLMDEIGYWSVEMWGGATFDTCLRFLKEDPWERITKLKKEMPNTPFQMLLRGQNIVGYRHYSDDIVEKFVEKACERGIDVFRIFDALNDPRNLQTAMRAVKKNGGVVEAGISYTISPVHDIPYYLKFARRLQELGADTICIKDMAGLISPMDAYELVKQLREETALPVHFHSHTTSGMALPATFKAVEAGAEIVDTAISSFSMGTSHSPTETVVAMLRGTEWDTGLDLKKLAEIAEYFKGVRKKYAAFESEHIAIDTDVLIYQIPGGMMSNFKNQLREAKKEDKLSEVFLEVPRVKADMGHIPLVTPTSQIVGNQAVLNVIYGERYKVTSNEIKNLVRGLYGKTPVEIAPDIRRKIIGDETPITVRPADLLEPEFDKQAKEAGPLAKTVEDVLSYALFPQVAPEFFKDREMNEKGLNLKDLAAVAAMYMRSTERKIDVKTGGNVDQWSAAARRESVGNGGWLV
ncbi:MAG: Pyruvate carboxylase subunit B [Methanomassiliicoccales archaeon PtaU1.Bin124]|nr:MAG: Pyruvate carboxylase subunit B [Methanomassiliicoccales archaeon PtaU1.Bin124]